MTNLEIIRKACIIANPDIQYWNERWEQVEFREIRLADVLLALDINSTDKRWNISVSSNLIRIERLGIIEFSDVVCIWELKNDNLELQSEETIKFLADLLVMEGK